MSAMSNTVDEIHTSGSLAEKAEIFHNGRGNASSFPHSLFIPLRAPLLAPKAPKIRTTLCRRDRYDFLFALLRCLFNSLVWPETERRSSTTLATWKEVHSNIAGLTKFMSKLCKISATQHLEVQAEQTFLMKLDAMFQCCTSKPGMKPSTCSCC